MLTGVHLLQQAAEQKSRFFGEIGWTSPIFEIKGGGLCKRIFRLWQASGVFFAHKLTARAAVSGYQNH